MPSELTQRFIRAVQHFEQADDLAPLLALFHEECEALTLGRTEPARGIRELEGYWRDYRSAFRGIHSEFTHVIEHPAGAVLEWVSRGALANGEPVQSKGVSVLETDGGRVRRLRLYYDSAVARGS
jgi:ketosteroid isomerase-like protein